MTKQYDPHIQIFQSKLRGQFCALPVTIASSHVDIRISSLVQTSDFQTVEVTGFCLTYFSFFLSTHYYFIACITILLLLLYIVQTGTYVPFICFCGCWLYDAAFLVSVELWCNGIQHV